MLSFGKQGLLLRGCGFAVVLLMGEVPTETHQLLHWRAFTYRIVQSVRESGAKISVGQGIQLVCCTAQSTADGTPEKPAQNIHIGNDLCGHWAFVIPTTTATALMRHIEKLNPTGGIEMLCVY